MAYGIDAASASVKGVIGIAIATITDCRTPMSVAKPEKIIMSHASTVTNVDCGAAILIELWHAARRRVPVTNAEVASPSGC